MLNSPSTVKPAKTRFLNRLPRLAGAATGSFGLLITISWYARWQPVLQMLPESAPMQYNTALCFVLAGAGLFLLTTPRARMAPWPAGLLFLFTLLTLLEYLAGRDFGIDLLFFKPYFEAATAFPGRMSPLSAVCFMLLGAGIMLARAKPSWSRRLAGSGLLACVVAVIAVVALLGYIFGIESAYGWGAYSRMAVNTAVLFLLIGAGLLIWSLEAARSENYHFLRWLPVAGSIALMTMIAFVSATNAVELRKATFWRKHTFEVILKAHAFEENLLDVQSGMRGYITTGDTNSLASFRAGVQVEPAQFNHLLELTRDNPEQQPRLKKLAAAMNEILSSDGRMIALCDQAGFKTALNPDPNGESRRLFLTARGILNAFSLAEKRLLDARDDSEQTNSRNAERLLLFGIVIAGVLLLFANFLAGRELNERLRIEREREKIIAELHQALAEVKTLSGMIPICAWCKNIRSDKGFWQTVEDYVRVHTDATFSHGVCPACSKKVRDEIAKANPGVAA